MTEGPIVYRAVPDVLMRRAEFDDAYDLPPARPSDSDIAQVARAALPSLLTVLSLWPYPMHGIDPVRELALLLRQDLHTI